MESKRKSSLGIRLAGQPKSKALFRNTRDVVDQLDANIFTQISTLSQSQKDLKNSKASGIHLAKANRSDEPFCVPDISPISKVDTAQLINAQAKFTDKVEQNGLQPPFKSDEKSDILTRRATPRRRRRIGLNRPTCKQTLKIFSDVLSENPCLDDSDAKNKENELCDKPILEEDSIIASRSFQKLLEGIETSSNQHLSFSIKDGKERPDDSISNLLENLSHDSLLAGTDLSKIDVQLTSEAKTHVQCVESDQNRFYGLPNNVRQLFIVHRGIENLYEWQDQCLKLDSIAARENLIYSLPTSGGKTLVAEILILRELLLHKRNALLILPYVSIVQEKVNGLSPFAIDLGFHVEQYAANKGTMPPRMRRTKNSIYIATIEKANAIVNSLIENGRTDELGLVVVDELHMIGDGSFRGATLEVCLAKVMYSFSKTQIVGMSATLGNIGDLQLFLKAKVYTNDFRPVKLTEYVKLNASLYKFNNTNEDENQWELIRKINHPKNIPKKVIQDDPDHISALAKEVIPAHSCLVFCPTKKNCENVSMLITRSLPSDYKTIKQKERGEVVLALKNAVNSICPTLRKTIPYGIAYHHGGLTLDERKIIEDAYSCGTLCLLCCTSTLAAGVNLPARRVILRAPYVGRDFLTRSRYRQMVGRAGRAGIDSSGESIVIVKEREKSKVINLVQGPMDNCISSLGHFDNKGIRSLVLSLIGLKICISSGDVMNFIKSTLFHIQLPKETKETGCDLSNNALSAINKLTDLGLLVKDTTTGTEAETNTNLSTTDLGRATFVGCLDADVVPMIYKELQRGLCSLSLLTDIHLLYLVTPFDIGENVNINWHVYYRQILKLNERDVQACELIGVTESFVANKAFGQRSEKLKDDQSFVQRLYIALMLYNLLNGKTAWDLADMFEITRGFIQSLLASTTSYAFLLMNFSKELHDLRYLVPLLDIITKKLSNTASTELLPLMEIPGVKQGRARQLHNAGYHTLQAVAWSTPNELVKAINLLSFRQATLVISSAKVLVQEKLEILKDEAEELMQDNTNRTKQLT